jgi:hypothetical protein
MFKGFGVQRQRKAENRKRKLEYEFKSLMGEMVAAARKACIDADIDPQFGQSLIVLAQGADIEGWLKSPQFAGMRKSILIKYVTKENIDTLIELEKTLQKIREDFVPRFYALLN